MTALAAASTNDNVHELQRAAPKVYAAIRQVMAAVRKSGIAKDKQGAGYKFRGIDDVYQALNEHLDDAALVIIPRATERKEAERTTAKGGMMLYSTITVEYDLVCAVDGSAHTARVIVTANDSQDKADSKCMSIAYKYLCFQVFCIPVKAGDVHDENTEQHDMVPRSRQQQRYETRQPQQQREQRQSELPPPPRQEQPARRDFARYWPLFKNSSNVNKPLKDVPTDSLTSYMSRLRNALTNPKYAADAQAYLSCAEDEIERRIESESRQRTGGEQTPPPSDDNIPF